MDSNIISEVRATYVLELPLLYNNHYSQFRQFDGFGLMYALMLPNILVSNIYLMFTVGVVSLLTKVIGLSIVSS